MPAPPGRHGRSGASRWFAGAALLFFATAGSLFLGDLPDYVDPPGPDLAYVVGNAVLGGLSAVLSAHLHSDQLPAPGPAPDPADDREWGAEAEYAPEPRSGPRCLAIGCLFLAVIAALTVGGVWLAAILLGKERPPEATDVKLLAVIDERFESCAEAAVFAPSDCPQRFDGGSSSPSWQLYGDPTAGASIEWNSFTGTFEIAGNAVMEIDYHDGTSSAVAVVPFGYTAKVSWKSGSARLDEITSLADGEAAEDVTKPRPELSDSAIKAAVAKAFERCVAVDTLHLPSACPDGGGNPTLQEYRWSLGNDPLRRATIGYDDRFGLVKVTGDYNIRVVHPEANNTGSEFEGRYEAVVVEDGAKAKVLTIESSN